MDIQKIEELIALLEKTSISEIEITEGDKTVRLSRYSQAPVDNTHIRYISSAAPQAPAYVEPAHTEEQKAKTPRMKAGHKIHSPMVGTMYTSPSPESPPFVSIGHSVKVGDTLCIIEAMKMFNEIEADRAGIIADILVKSGDPVEYDQILFILEE